ncbi:TPA: DUF4225 domain-containing protein [Klebsiella aerogenes]
MGVFFGGVQVIGGSGITASSLMTGNVIGVIAGATLMFHGFGTMAEKLDGVNFSEKYYEDASQFLGFSRGLGKLSHQVVDLSTSFYGLAKLTLIENLIHQPIVFCEVHLLLAAFPRQAPPCW